MKVLDITVSLYETEIPKLKTSEVIRSYIKLCQGARFHSAEIDEAIVKLFAAEIDKRIPNEYGKTE
ncbi:MAG: hypothetical protein WC761_01975 [Candidatus Paceibacterota bacterium]